MIENLRYLIRREPVVVTQTVTAVITSILALLVEFQIPISEPQQDAIRNVILALGVLISTVIARSKVTPIAEPRV